MAMKITLQLPQPFLHPPSSSSSSFSSSAAATKTAVNGLLYREKLLYLQSLEIDPRKALSLNPLLQTTPLSAIRSVEDCLVDAFGLPQYSLSRLFTIHPDLLTVEPSALFPVCATSSRPSSAAPVEV